VGSTLEPMASTKPLKLRPNQCARGCGLVHLLPLIFKNVYSVRSKGEGTKDRTVQFDTDFETDAVIIVGTEGTKNET
jgi:hypothetical protein